MSPLLALAALQTAPLERLVGEWTSLETVETSAGQKTLRLKGQNRWVFKGELLAIDETYTVDGDPKPGRNHILLQSRAGGKLAAWWHVPQAADPLVFDGTAEDGGMTLTRRDGKMRIVYRWDGPKAYDAKLQTRPTSEAEWTDRTVARYTRK